MGQHQSSEKSLYEAAVKGNVQAIKSLRSNGAGLEYIVMQWLDEEGNTPLMVACSSLNLFTVAKTLIELGANVSSYRAGGDGGTPLHHAAKRGLHQTVQLLLSHGANPLARNNDGQTPLDVARIQGFVDVVRAIESHISFFSGWIREFYGPGILEALAPQLLSRKIWAVIIPCGFHDPTKLELLIYLTLLDFRPSTIIDMWNADIMEPNFHQSDPVLIIFDKSTNTRYRFASANDGDKQQLQCLYNTCRGIPNNANDWEDAADESTHSGWGPLGGPTRSESSITKWVDNPAAEEYNGWGTSESTRPSSHSIQPATKEYNGWEMPELSRPLNHSSQPAPEEYNGWGVPESTRPSNNSTQPTAEEYNGWGMLESSPNNTSPFTEKADNILPVIETSNELPSMVSTVPSAPPIPEEDLGEEDGVNYPQVDVGAPRRKEAQEESACVVCWEAHVEGACIPCGHMAACMSCLSTIKSKQGSCPVCRAKIDQVVKIFAV